MKKAIAVLLLLGCADLDPTPAQQEPKARAWAERLGYKVEAVVCTSLGVGIACTVRLENVPMPVSLQCGSQCFQAMPR